MKRRGHTMVEIGIAAVLLGTVLGIAMVLFTSAARQYRRGVAAARGPEGAILFLGQLERDLAQVLQVPGDPRPPAAVGDGSRLALYRTSAARSGPNIVVGEPVSWTLTPAGPAGLFHPTRNGRPLESVLLAGCSFELLEPSAEANRPFWAVLVTLQVAGGSQGEETFETTWASPLVQPSSNFLHYPGHGESLVPGEVRLLPWLPGEAPPAALAPPRAGGEGGS